ncbi:MAG: hypothetical protein VX278_10130 [Myxococcota bacterium]|nr:hypothetical protein [Myxococcota bacterium]
MKPLHSCIQAWRALAKWRGEELKRYSSPSEYGSLGVLESPFPDVVGRLLCLNIDTLIQTEELELHHKKGDVRWYQIRDHGQSLLLEGQKEDTERHRLAAQAWQRYSTSHTRQDMVAYHKVCAKEDPSRHIIAALEHAVESNQFVNAKKWLNYLDCQKTKKSSFTVEYARAILSLHIEPGFIYEEQFVLLSQLCRTTEQRLQLQFLRFINRTRVDKESPFIVSDGKKLIQQLKEKLPYLSLDLYRHLSLFLLEKSQVPDGLMLCQTAIQLGDALLQGLKEPRLSQIQQKKLLLQITLSGLLVYASKHKESVQACRDGIVLSRRMNLPKYQTGFLINAAICQIELGEREKAKQNISFCSSLMERYESQPRTIAFCSLTQARLSIERGEFDRGFSKLDESISIGQNLNDLDLLCQAWSLTLDAAVSSGRSKEGKRAIRAYQMMKNHSAHRRDHWPAALARWYWMIGDLKRATESLQHAREGYSQGRILMERSRILLIGGKIQEAFTECKKLKTFAQENQFRELSLYAQLLSAVTEKVSDGKIRPLLEQASQEEWTELYLGSLHLDLIRRKLRRQPLQKSLVLLNKRSAALNHMLFSELSKSENW